MLFWHSRHSAEYWENKLPKPLYIVLAVCSVIAIILVGVFSSIIGVRMSKAAESVLELYVNDSNISQE